MLLCTVRNCGLPLERQNRRLSCAKGHSFDVARSGYVNLLQPQDKRSRVPGDSIAAVAARRRVHDRYVTRPLSAGVASVLHPSAADVILDAGCGDGFYLGALTQGPGCQGSGVDISIPAIDAAARRYPQHEWVVANADRMVPWQDRTFSAVISITGRMNPPEFHRVLKPDGRLLIALPSPDDLIELRGQGRDRRERTIEEFSPLFKVVAQKRVTTNTDLDGAAVEDVLLAIYRPMRNEPPTAMRLTFGLDILLFHPADSQ